MGGIGLWEGLVGSWVYAGKGLALIFCHRCGGEMVLRTAKSGKQAGRHSEGAVGFRNVGVR